MISTEQSLLAPNDKALGVVSVLKQRRVCWNRTLSSADWGLFTQELQFRFVSRCLVLVVQANPRRHPALEYFHSTLPPYSHNHLSFWLSLTERKYEIQVEKRNNDWLGQRLSRNSDCQIVRTAPPPVSLSSLFCSTHICCLHLPYLTITSAKMVVGFCFKKSIVFSVTMCISLELIATSSLILKYLHTPLMLQNVLMMPVL